MFGRLHVYLDMWWLKFSGIARHIAASGYAVYAMDYPGFGLSEGLHGYIPSFDQLVDDVIEQYKKFKGLLPWLITLAIIFRSFSVGNQLLFRVAGRAELKGLPHFILGQSMGGAVTLKVHLKEPKLWDGVVLVAPMCKVSSNISMQFASTFKKLIL